MEIFISDSYEASSKIAANDLKNLIGSGKDLLLCTASGDSPAGLYKELVNLVSRKELNISSCDFLGLDEWGGMNGSDEGSCRFHLNQQLFEPLKIAKNKICFFDGKAEDLQKECDDVENYIQQHQGIDVAIVGLGLNGHIGMNEPGTPQDLRSHVTAIDPLTAKTGQKYFKEPKQLTNGLTLGLATLLEAKNIFLLVSGKHKAGIVKRMLEEKVSEQLPATLLRNHKGLRIYLDKEAASLIPAK
jgi:glucosamine-6-phosphate isomerase